MWGKREALRLLCAAISHHCEPVDGAAVPDAETLWGRGSAGSLAPLDGVRRLAAGLRRWFPAAYEPVEHALHNPEFQHVFCGLVMLADWIGSDDPFSPYAEPGDGDRTRSRASRGVERARDVGVSLVRAYVLGSTLPGFAAVFGMEPRPVLRQNSARAASGSSVVSDPEIIPAR